MWTVNLFPLTFYSDSHHICAVICLTMLFRRQLSLYKQNIHLPRICVCVYIYIYIYGLSEFIALNGLIYYFHQWINKVSIGNNRWNATEEMHSVSFSPMGSQRGEKRGSDAVGSKKRSRAHQCSKGTVEMSKWEYYFIRRWRQNSWHKHGYQRSEDIFG